eukprot:gnl/MRDRNA2_/MRDRNA2_217828_c0_seq1.p1 gnl/MRDRNA2_/MRDRNA2_217828_c0~~gnl/MRDRNA2_/MRDRNA2_217828_c0_seq1.p1  ORF type:complete len:199 (+),score=46.58 gnl/MRDRNA2_/MRDRNA2_217828_c0_seq1:79-597(+)
MMQALIDQLLSEDPSLRPQASEVQSMLSSSRHLHVVDLERASSRSENSHFHTSASMLDVSTLSLSDARAKDISQSIQSYAEYFDWDRLDASMTAEKSESIQSCGSYAQFFDWDKLEKSIAMTAEKGHGTVEEKRDRNDRNNQKKYGDIENMYCFDMAKLERAARRQERRNRT